jgi:hypothetical protein
MNITCYMLGGHGFEMLLDARFLSIHLIIPAIVVSAVYSTSDRDEYQRQK